MRAWPRRNFILAGVGVAAAALALVAVLVERTSGLSAVHEGIAASHPSVDHIDAAEFAQHDRRSLVVFDTREAEEFSVSHLAGAIRIPPDLPAEDFLLEYGDLVEGMTVVFYCSVGARSSQFAEQTQSALRGLGAVDVVNLKRGLFGWHNEERPLVDTSGKATRMIHPYDEYWGRLVDRSELISRIPEKF
ncbi:rhodanese-like domain-containing protein [Erythrobacter sp. W53]|uniref:rhodanese-like domain-containing protein n=1 Tax=Erythrobacter sp. W53 TaxID=3425947 RepID=UPI003D767AA9